MGQNGNNRSRNGGIFVISNAARAGKHALVLTTVSDHLIRKEYLSADERQYSFDEMVSVALETAVELN